MTTLQLLILAGALVGLGLALLLVRAAPARPDLGQTLGRLSPAGARQAQQALEASRARAGSPGATDVREILGGWAGRTLPAALWGRVRASDLAVVGMSLPRFYGEKLVFAFVGLVAGPVISLVFIVLFSVPLFVPVLASLALAAVLWFLPDYNVRSDAAAARVEFSRSLGAFVDLVTLEMASGSGPRQAMQAAALVGDSWIFARLREELARTRWSGATPWEALRGLGDELEVADLHELADIIRLSGEDGGRIYPQLKARAASMRGAVLAAQKARANEVSERMTLPMTLLALVFLVILVAPQVLRMTGG